MHEIFTQLQCVMNMLHNIYFTLNTMNYILQKNNKVRNGPMRSIL